MMKSKKTITQLSFLLFLSVLILVLTTLFALFSETDSYVDSEGVLHDNFFTTVVPIFVFLGAFLSTVVLLCVMLYKAIMKGKNFTKRRLIIFKNLYK